MPYINERMPRRLAAGFKTGPEFKTRIVSLDNGREQRNREWLYPRWKAQGNMAAFEAKDRQDLIGLFMVTAGQWAAFRMMDPTDNFVAAEPIAPAIGTTQPVQLVRAYRLGAANALAKIQAPQDDAQVFRNGVLVPGTMDFGLGLFTPTSPWSAGTYTWTGHYDRWMRLDSDWGAFTANTLGIYTTDIELVEDRR